MNSNQRRKFVRSEQDHHKKFDIVMSNGERWLMKRCVPCAAALSLKVLLSSNTLYSCGKDCWKVWLETVGETNLAILLESPEGTQEWLEADIKAEAERRAESFFTRTVNESK